MTALYGRVHEFGRWQHAREAIYKAIDAGAVHMEMIYAGGGRGGTNAVVVGMATVHRETQRAQKQESDQLVVALRSLSAACRSTKPLQLLAAINCA